MSFTVDGDFVRVRLLRSRADRAQRDGNWNGRTEAEWNQLWEEAVDRIGYYLCMAASPWERFWSQVAIAALLAWINDSDIEAMPPTEPWDGRFDCPEQWI